MAILWHDGFDQYAAIADAAQIYSNTSSMVLETSPVRTGRLSYRVTSTNNGAEKTIPSAVATLVCGFAVNFINDTQTEFFRMLDGTTVHVGLQRTTAKEIAVLRGGSTQLAISSGLNMLSGVWYYVEFKANIHDTTGTVEVRVNGVNVASGTGLDTRNAGNATVDRIRLHASANNQTRFDDLYILDTTGSAPNNDFLGDVKVLTKLPDGAGNYSAWTPSAGSNFQNVDDASGPDDDTTYNSSSTAAQKDSYTVANVGQTGTIYSLITGSYSRKDDAGARSARNMLRISATDYFDTTFSVLDSFTWNMALRETNPNTAAAWTVSNVDGLEAGIELVS